MIRPGIGRSVVGCGLVLVLCCEAGAVTITCPANIVQNNDPGHDVAFVNYPLPTVSGGTLLSYSPPPGLFTLGTTPVICIASGGSPPQMETCTFTVTVIDAEPPVITCPAAMSANAPAGRCTANVSYSWSVVDNGPGVTVSGTPPSGSAFPVGTTSVHITATDAANNTATCSFNVTVSDAQGPTIACGSEIRVPSDPGGCTAIVTFPVPSVADNCAGATVVSTPPSGSAFPIGTTMVSSVATDASGHSATCSFAVIVDDAGGCPAAHTDTDGDGTSDLGDGCPNDANKTAPGACGCGTADSDANGNGVADCLDGDGAAPGSAPIVATDPALQANDAMCGSLCGGGVAGIVPLTIAGLGIARRRQRAQPRR